MDGDFHSDENSDSITRSFLSRPVGYFQFTVRTSNCLAASNIISIADLIRHTENELLRIPNMGRKSVCEITSALTDCGLELGLSEIEIERISALSEYINIDNLSKCKTKLSSSIAILDLTIRSYNGLKAAGIHLISDLVQYTEMELRRIPNLGIKSISEILDNIELLDLTLGMSAAELQIIINREMEGNQDDDVNNQSILTRSVDILGLTARSLNCLKTENINTIGELLLWNENDIARIPNMGKKSLSEIKAMLASYNLEFGQRNLSIKNPNEEYNFQEDPRDFIETFIETTLTNCRTRSVFYKRHGLFGEKKLTLEALGKEYSLTRERIRQIEKSATSKLLVAFENRFNQDIKNIELIKKKYTGKISAIIFKDKIFISFDRLMKEYKSQPKWLKTFILFISKSDVTHFMNVFYSYSEEYEGWFQNIHEMKLESNNQEYRDKKTIIKSAIQSELWPVNIESVAKKASLPFCVVIDYVSFNDKEYRIERRNDNYYLKFKRLTVQERLLHIFRQAKRSLIIDDIREEHKKWFGKEITIGQVTSTLGYMNDALIVGRREYNIYENMNLNSAQLQKIRDSTESYLLKRNKYISSKVILKELQRNSYFDASYLAEVNNGHVLLGILQDDTRFDCQRGFMIGLHSNRFEAKFKPLGDEIYELFRSKNRPISLNEIVEHFQDSRELIVPSIQNFLNQTNMYKNIDSNRYVLVESNSQEQEVDELLAEDALFMDW